MLRDHITQRHPNQPFTFICTDDKTNNERLKDMIRRSTSPIQSTDHDACLSVTGTSPDDIGSPFIITLLPSPQPKVEIVDIERSTTRSTITTSDSLIKIEKPTGIKSNLSVGLGNCRCETCHESVPRNLLIIRDQVKVRFKEKTGCVPADLTHLLPSLQQIYCQLLMTSFPSVGASMLNDDIPNYKQTTNQEETEDNGMIQDKDNGQEIPVEDKTESPNPFSCQICDGAFSSVCAMKAHRARKHGILVKWHCKECNINIETKRVPRHLLIVHLGKMNPSVQSL